MHQVKNTGEGRSFQAQWLQLGLLAASIVAPLMHRWNELRAMERTRALREDIEDRLQIIRASSPWNHRSARKQVEEVIQDIDATLPERRSAPRSSTIFWIAGVGIGVIAAGIGTYVLVKRRMASYQEEPLVPLPFRRPDRQEGIQTPGTADQVPDAANHTSQQASSSSITDIEATAIVGNIRTMAYHLATDDNLPDEDNRIYFSSEEEARLAGYHLHSH
ncbi:MAG: hypothetical protein C5B60_03360 [Chloroflexi bacterium]|nr:MAG: hypothetical protein C5B60_03360 [Chloroflexota bacterium]